MAIGAVLHQVQEGVERVLEYYSKSLNSAQLNYCTTKKRCKVSFTPFADEDDEELFIKPNPAPQTGDAVTG